MKRLLTVLFLITLTAVAIGEEIRREPISKKQKRQGLVYVVNEQNGYTGVIYEEHDNGQLVGETPYKDGKVEGVLKNWHENGQLMVEAPYKDNKKEGVGKVWHENGQLIVEIPYKDDKEEGISKTWYANGQLRLESPYKDGKKEGISKMWHENGQLNTTTALAGSPDSVLSLDRKTSGKVVRIWNRRQFLS